MHRPLRCGTGVVADWGLPILGVDVRWEIGSRRCEPAASRRTRRTRPAAPRGSRSSTAHSGMASDSPRSVSQLLDAWGRGDRAALDALVPEVYAMLHQQAPRALRDQPDGHTLQPTALVNEAYVRLANQPGAGADSRSHFFAVAAMVMRSVLVDHARARQRAKRGGNARALSLGAADGVAAGGGCGGCGRAGRSTRSPRSPGCAQGPRGRAALLRRAEHRGDGEGAGLVAGDRQARVDRCARVAPPRAHDGVTMRERAATRPAAPVSAERWNAIMAIFADAVERPPAERAAFVAEACGSDAELRAEVESLLAAHDGDADFLEAPLTRRPTETRRPRPSGCRRR